jgi:hypothetical protein
LSPQTIKSLEKTRIQGILINLQLDGSPARPQFQRGTKPGKKPKKPYTT